MVQYNMSGAFKLFSAIAIISGLIYLFQRSADFEFFIHSDITLAAAIISGMIALWAWAT